MALGCCWPRRSGVQWTQIRVDSAMAILSFILSFSTLILPGRAHQHGSQSLRRTTSRTQGPKITKILNSDNQQTTAAMLFMKLLLNFLVAGVAIASVVPADKSGAVAVKNAKDEIDEDGSGSVLVEYSSSVKFSIESHFNLIIQSCSTGKYQVVISSLEEVYKKLLELNDGCHKSSFEFDEVVEFSHEFVKVLLKFQAILFIIKSHPFIADKCGATLFKCGYEFSEIFKFILSYKIDIHALTISVGIDYSIFGGIGHAQFNVDNVRNDIFNDLPFGDYLITSFFPTPSTRVPKYTACASHREHQGISPRARFDATDSNSYTGSSANRNSSDDSAPQCSFHQSIFQDTTSGIAPTETTSTDHGIKITDCYDALGHLLHERNGASMFQMDGTTKRKSCGTCRLQIEAKNTKELFIPLNKVIFGTSRDRSGGLNGIFEACHKRGGQIMLQPDGMLKIAIRIDVSKSAANRDCSLITTQT
ncbi:hypothetical protein PtA15_16A212 [Puccinia triticina]|uniref:Uncharacterized protein n=1 Tax=Puccinia triticina TaxID=208348 RepID=A0ABY7D7I1_9BASI|nr:uncharacterized protein PtA15_16A212 [Puccinia triticina]WAQ92306.1 hypothetical protein PtA15_16A212 [Puccinia triticina]WAR64043.1 hypothetical protein PtB15_16B202 [Puccinia triticina]